MTGAGEHAAQHQAQNAVRTGAGIGERQRRAPGPAKGEPFVHAQMDAQLLDVVDEMSGGIVFQRGIGTGASATALIKDNDAVAARIKEAPHGGGRAASRPAMQGDDGHAVRASAVLVIQAVTLTHVQKSGVDRGQGRIQPKTAMRACCVHFFRANQRINFQVCLP